MNISDILQRPIPDMTELRKVKRQYREYPRLLVGERDNEPMVSVDEFGLAGQGHYSRANSATGEAVPGVHKPVFVRQSIADKLSKINYALQVSDEVAELLGGKVELYVDEGYRSAELQAKLYNDVFPNMIRNQHPEWDEATVMKHRNQLIAEPPRPDGSPSPHLTGAAVDLTLRYAQPDLDFVFGCGVEMGRKPHQIGYASWPDYFEHHKPSTKQEREAQKNRRVFYWVMRGALLDSDSGFVVNPTEWWHWSYGDQMWAQLTEAPAAFYASSPVGM